MSQESIVDLAAARAELRLRAVVKAELARIARDVRGGRILLWELREGFGWYRFLRDLEKKLQTPLVQAYSETLRESIWFFRGRLDLPRIGKVGVAAVREKAQEWAAAHAAETVRELSIEGQRAVQYILGQSDLLRIPSAAVIREIEGAVTLTKGQLSNIGKKVHEAISAGRPMSAAEIKQLYAERLTQRAELIGLDESRRAANAGLREAYRESGLPIRDVDGVFQDGSSGPPAHMRCRCWTEIEAEGSVFVIRWKTEVDPCPICAPLADTVAA